MRRRLLTGGVPAETSDSIARVIADISTGVSPLGATFGGEFWPSVGTLEVLVICRFRASIRLARASSWFFTSATTLLAVDCVLDA
jgi:hypothetical protein